MLKFIPEVHSERYIFISHKSIRVIRRYDYVTNSVMSLYIHNWNRKQSFKLWRGKFFNASDIFDTMNRRRRPAGSLTELTRAPLPRIVTQISRVQRTNTHLTRSHRSSLATFPEVTERQGHGSLVWECRPVQRDMTGRILSSVTVSVSDQNSVSRGAVLSFTSAERTLPHWVMFLFPRSTPDVQLDNQ